MNGPHPPSDPEIAEWLKRGPLYNEVMFPHKGAGGTDRGRTQESDVPVEGM